MKTPLKLFLLTLLAYGLFMTVQLPARLLLQAWPPPAGWQWQQLSGSVWHGRVQGLRYQGRALGRLQWRVRPARLLLGELALAWRLDGGYGQAGGVFDAALWDGESAVHDLELDLAMSLVSDLGWSPLTLGGRLQGRLDQVSLPPASLPRAQGQLQWRGATLGTAGSISLGQVRMRAGGQGEAKTVVVDNQGGDLRLDGSLGPAGAHAMELRLSLHPLNANGKQAVRLLLAAGGSRAGDGVEFRYAGAPPL